MLTEISNGMQGTMKRQFCRFRDSDMYNKTCLAGATINVRPRMGSFISYCGCGVFIHQMFLLRSTLQTNDVTTQIH